MRFLLAIMAMTLFAVSVGCDAPPAEPKSEPAAGATDGDHAEGDHAEGDHAEGDAAKGDGASTEAANSETQTVSLKLPGMT